MVGAVPTDGVKVVDDSGKDAEEVCLEVSNGYFRCIAPVVVWWDQFHLHLVRVAYDFFH